MLSSSLLDLRFSCRTARGCVHRRQPSSCRSADSRASTARARTDAPHLELGAGWPLPGPFCALTGPDGAGHSRILGVRPSSRVTRRVEAAATANLVAGQLAADGLVVDPVLMHPEQLGDLAGGHHRLPSLL